MNFAFEKQFCLLHNPFRHRYIYVTIAEQAGRYTAHLCAGRSIKDMPETEIPPVSEQVHF